MPVHSRRSQRSERQTGMEEYEARVGYHISVGEQFTSSYHHHPKA